MSIDHEGIKKISAEIDRLVRVRDEKLGATDLASDLALQTNVEAIGPLYSARSFKELENTCSTIIQLCSQKWIEQRTFEAALADHAKMPQGIPIPKYWNPAYGSFFRGGAPIVVSSESGVGKSTTALNICVNNILNKTTTVYITNEDSMAEALIKMFTIHTKLNRGITYSFQEVEKWLHLTAKGAPKYREQAQAVYEFAKIVKKYVVITEAEYWSMSRVIFAAERAENEFGEPPRCVIVDYAQRIEPEHSARGKDIRLQMIDNSRMWANYVKTKKIVGILISQLNDEGKTAESRQFERDAGQWIVIERKRDKDTEELSKIVEIKIKKGRRTGTGKMVCSIDGASGALIPSEDWKPSDQDMYAS